MTAMVSETKMNKNHKIILQLVVGAAVGALVGYFGASLLKGASLAGDQVAVVAIGAMYLVMGAFCGFGVLFPKVGSNLLNVEDEEDLREQRRILTGSAISTVALGAALAALALAGPGQMLSRGTGLGALLAALLLLVTISVRDWHLYDELMMGISRDAGNFAFCGIGTTLLIWASAAWLGMAAAPTPLALVAIISGGFLFAVFVAAARRGMLIPR